MHNYNSHNIHKHTIYSGTPSTIRNTPESIIKSEFHRTNSDLIATTPEGKEIVFVDYFSNFEPPSIITENGLLLKGSVLKALAGPLAKGQYVQATGDGALSIGEVSSVTGTVKATRLDGTTSCLLYTSPSPRDRQKSRMPSSA